MPRKIFRPSDLAIPAAPPAPLAVRLAQELRSEHPYGQPMIDERHLQTGLKRIVVFWDAWEGLPDEERATVILEAYDEAEGPQSAGAIVLASGYTIPEAVAEGLLPFEVVTAWRRDDQVSLEQLREAMIEQGASIIHDPDQPQLRFATISDAQACVQRLVERLPASEQVWQIRQKVGASLGLARNR